MATEAFLKGCREKMAAQRAMERNPKTVHKALNNIKASVANQRALFGSRAPHYPSRQMEFADGTKYRDDKVEEDTEKMNDRSSRNPWSD
ncbi:hypothetical protein KP79_PYT24278 [Mizuhopecten yessoensis]|uniref:Uncharacterized protein n=1 Tax=Mizuhopecten yessoensis TaxID=6573 RepID=A0A210QRE3_MIZYE|nr:hypothetical protein KP79_PYT24278 [Mizuhopecten yessoensis]